MACMLWKEMVIIINVDNIFSLFLLQGMNGRPNPRAELFREVWCVHLTFICCVSAADHTLIYSRLAREDVPTELRRIPSPAGWSGWVPVCGLSPLPWHGAAHGCSCHNGFAACRFFAHYHGVAQSRDAAIIKPTPRCFFYSVIFLWP